VSKDKWTPETLQEALDFNCGDPDCSWCTHVVPEMNRIAKRKGLDDLVKLVNWQIDQLEQGTSVSELVAMMVPSAGKTIH
jgi:hypothetical protein